MQVHQKIVLRVKESFALTSVDFLCSICKKAMSVLLNSCINSCINSLGYGLCLCLVERRNFNQCLWE